MFKSRVYLNWPSAGRVSGAFKPPQVKPESNQISLPLFSALLFD